MLRWPTERWTMRIQHAGITVRASAGSRAPKPELTQTFDPASPAPGLEACFQQLVAQAGLLEIVIDDGLARYWMVSPPRQATRFADLHAAAALQFESLFSCPANEWLIEGDWGIANGFMACALPRRLIDEIRRVHSRYAKRISLLSCQPDFVDQWNKKTGLLDKDMDCFAVSGNRLTTVALVNRNARQQIEGLISLPFPIETSFDIEKLDNRIRAYCLQHEHPFPEKPALISRMERGFWRNENIESRWDINHAPD